jgi:hypothetical protein
MIRIGTVGDIGPILASIRDPDTMNIELFGEKIHVSSVRLQTFAVKGVKCVFCGKEGEFFAAEKSHERDGGYHINLYGYTSWQKDSDGMFQRRELLFTRDHILPKSKGGPDVLENMQTACKKCNEKKDNRIIANEDLRTTPKKKPSKKSGTRKMMPLRRLMGMRWDNVPWMKDVWQ